MRIKRIVHEWTNWVRFGRLLARLFRAVPTRFLREWARLPKGRALTYWELARTHGADLALMDRGIRPEDEIPGQGAAYLLYGIHTEAWHCQASYCTGHEESETVAGKEAAIEWLRRRQDPRHVDEGNRVMYSATGLVVGGETIRADLTQLGCARSYGSARRIE